MHNNHLGKYRKMNNYKPESEKRKKKRGKKKKKRNSPEFSRADDLRASSNSFSLLVAIAASSVFLWRTCMRKVRWLAIIWISITYLIHTCTTKKKKKGRVLTILAETDLFCISFYLIPHSSFSKALLFYSFSNFSSFQKISGYS